MTTPSSAPSASPDTLVDESTQDIPALTRTTSEPITEPEPKKKPRVPKGKKAPGDDNKENEDPDAAPKRPKRAKKDPDASGADQPKSKRGHARPHRRLESETIVARIEKLDRRIQRAQTQLAEATRHAQGYKREMTFRPDRPEGKSEGPSLEEALEGSLGKAD